LLIAYEQRTQCGHTGKLVCRYLFRRCDNEAAPWSAADAGDGAWAEDDLPEDAVAEIARCTEAVTYAGEAPFWDYNASKGAWGWARDPPSAAAAGQRSAKSATGKNTMEQLAKDVKAVCPRAWCDMGVPACM
jgi:hypothetical protein